MGYAQSSHSFCIVLLAKHTLFFKHWQDVLAEEVCHLLFADSEELSLYPPVLEKDMSKALITRRVCGRRMGHYGEGGRGAERFGLLHALVQVACVSNLDEVRKAV